MFEQDLNLQSKGKTANSELLSVRKSMVIYPQL